MRIAFFTDTYDPNVDGVVRSIHITASQLRATGHQVTVVTSGHGRSKVDTDSLLLCRGFGRFYDDRFTIPLPPRDFMHRLQAREFDVVHTHTLGPMGLIGVLHARRHGIPIVSTWHTDLVSYVSYYRRVLPAVVGLAVFALTVVVRPGIPGVITVLASVVRKDRRLSLSARLVRAISPLIHAECHAIVAPSRKAKSQLDGLSGGTQIRVIPTASRIEACSRSRSRIRSGWSVPEEALLLAYVGRLAQEKNVALLLRSLQNIESAEGRAPVYLLLAGRHRSQDRLEELATKLNVSDRVKFVGWIDHAQIGCVYTSADVFTFPSLTDTQGLTLLEAAQCGLPVITVDRGLTDYVIEGVNGFVVEPEPSSFAVAVKALRDDASLRASMSAASRNLANTTMDWQEPGKSLSMLYDEVGRPPRSSLIRG